MTIVHEWRNSFVLINRVPVDVLSLIPTYLSSQGDRFRASFVCRHWRGIFLQRAELWSQLSLSKGEDYVETLFKRAKGSALEIMVDDEVPVSTMALLSSRSRQIRSLHFECEEWSVVRWFLAADHGSLPLLHTITVDITEGYDAGFDETPPSLPYFGDAVDLRMFRFHLHAMWSPLLNHFAFPRLVSFDFSVCTAGEFSISQLLDFLEASPILRTVHITIDAELSLAVFPQERVVVLPNVENFTLIMTISYKYEIMDHISCPSVQRMSLVLKQDTSDECPEAIFPYPDEWGTIVRHYTKSPAEEAILEIKTAPIAAGTLTLRSSNATVIELCHDVPLGDGEEEMFPPNPHEIILPSAIEAIRNYPHLAKIRRLSICDSYPSVDAYCLPSIRDEARELFKFMGPLNELTINCDLRPYLPRFFDLPEDHIVRPTGFPSIREFMISRPVDLSDRECAAIIAFARSQHASGIPFERIILRWECIPAWMARRLMPWVGCVELYHDESAFIGFEYGPEICTLGV